MAKKIINIGTVANDKNGDPLRTAFSKVNDNFTEVYALLGGASADLQELAQDYAAAMITGGTHSGLSVAYDDNNNKLNFTVNSLDLSSVNQNIVPSTTLTYSLGSPTKKWHSMYVGTGSIYVGDAVISVTGGKLTSSVGFSATSLSLGGVDLSVDQSGKLVSSSGFAVSAGDVLPANAVGYLKNNGSGTLTWEAVSAGVTNLNGLTDVDYSGPGIQAGDTLKWNALTGTFVNGKVAWSEIAMAPTIPSIGNIEFRNDTINDLAGITITNADQTTSATASLSVPANGSGTVSITNTGNVWGFDTYGTLTVPGDIARTGWRISSNQIDTGPSGTVTSISLITESLSVDRRLEIYSESNRLHLDSHNPTTELYIGDNSQFIALQQSGEIFVSATGGLSLHGGGANSYAKVVIPNQADAPSTPLYVRNMGNAGVRIEAGPMLRSWQFRGSDGGLVFPDNTVQTTAWLGTADVVRNVTSLGGTVSIQTASQQGDPDKTWLFKHDGAGSLILTDGSTIRAKHGFNILATAPEFVNFTSIRNFDSLSFLDLTNIVIINPTASMLDAIDPASPTCTAVIGATVRLMLTNGVVHNYQLTSAFVGEQNNPFYGLPVWTATIPNSGIASTSIKEVSIEYSANWNFNTNGSVTFPDNTIQTTAWTGIARSVTQVINTNATINTSKNITTNNLYTNPTNFVSDIIPNGFDYVFPGLSQRNPTQIEVDLFVPPAGALQTFLTGLALGRTVVATYSTAGGTGTITGPVSQAFSVIGQSEPTNNWIRVSGRIDGTVPVGYTGLVSVNFPVYSTASHTWTFSDGGMLTVPTVSGEGLFIQGAEIGSTNSGIGITATNGIVLTTAALGTPKFWSFGTNGSLTFPDTTIQTTAYLGITHEVGGSSTIVVGGSNMTRDALSVRIVAGMGSTLNVEINYSLPDTSATVMGSSTTVASTQVLTQPLNIFSGQQTLTANNTTWTIINAETLSTIGDSVTAVISDTSFHRMYRVTVMARTLPDVGAPGDAYCTIEVLK